MFKHNNLPSDSQKTNSDVRISGTFTNESYTMYSSICENPRKTNKRNITLTVVITLLIAISSVIFAFSIRNAFFKSDNAISTEPAETVKSIKTELENNGMIEAENITDEISELYNIPVGIKIISLDTEDNEYLDGLQSNDIIVNVSGTSVTSINEVTQIINNHQTEGTMISYTVYRNGAYQEIHPFE